MPNLTKLVIEKFGEIAKTFKDIGFGEFAKTDKSLLERGESVQVELVQLCRDI